MRCLTLSEGLLRRGHEVHFVTNETGVPWLEAVLGSSPVVIHRTVQHCIDLELFTAIAPDWVVVDSYEIPAESINGLQSLFKLFAIIDSDDRGIVADLYLDHNLGAETLPWPDHVSRHLLAGNTFALVRDAILAQRKTEPWKLNTLAPHILAFMGGSDPTGTICLAGEVLSQLETQVQSTIVASTAWQSRLHKILARNPDCRVLMPTPELPELLSNSDIAISAAGTSAWELCTLGIPSVLMAVVDNQDESLARLVTGGYALGITRDQMNVEKLSEAVTTLLNNENIRRELSQRCLTSFDGKGKNRVVEAMERLLESSIG